MMKQFVNFEAQNTGPYGLNLTLAFLKIFKYTNDILTYITVLNFFCVNQFVSINSYGTLYF